MEVWSDVIYSRREQYTKHSIMVVQDFKDFGLLQKVNFSAWSFTRFQKHAMWKSNDVLINTILTIKEII